MKRMIVSATQSVRRMTYKEVLAELKKCITKRDKKRMEELSASRYYHDAMDELRKSMGICASEIIGSRYDITQDSGQWYVTEVETGDVVDGPFDSEDEALSYFSEDEIEYDENFNEEDYMTEEELAAVQHEKYLSWFDSYAKRLPGKVNVDGYVGSRNFIALENFVEAFNKHHPEAQLDIETKVDSDGEIYFVV